MKKLYAILLIVIFLFNLFGYRLFFNYVSHKADINLETSLDRNEFNEAELIAVIVPLSVPYQNDQQDFERVDGELQINGKLYKYVKRKVSNGQLVIMCLPDYKKMQLHSAKDEFFKYASDLVQNNNSKKSENSKSGVFKNLAGEYDNFTSPIANAPVSDRIVYSIFSHSSNLPSSPHSSPEQPPELL